MPVLPPASAVTLSAELHDVVEKLRCLDGNEKSAGYAHDPEVAIASDETDCFSRQVSKDSISGASTAWGPQISSFSESSVDEICSGGLSSDRQMVLLASADRSGRNSTFSVELRGDAKVSELRKLLACSMQLAPAKVQVMAEADGVARALDDNDRADLADILFIRKSPAGYKAHPPELSLEQTLALQKDFLDGLTESATQPISTLLEKEIWESVVSKHGLKPSPIVNAGILRAVDTHATNSESRRLGEEVNELLGLQPQVYRLQATQSTALASYETDCFSRQVSNDSIGLASTDWGPQISSFSESSVDEICPGGFSLDRQMVLLASADRSGRNSTFSVELRGDARVSELRKLLACSMQLAPAKVQVMAEADGVAWALGDNDRADLAGILFIRKSSAACKAVPPVLSLEQTLALQKDFLDGLTECATQPISTLLEKEIMQSVVSKHGLKPSPIVMAGLLRAVDIHAANSESRRLGEAVNEVLGLQPQVYRLQAMHLAVSMGS